MNYLSPHDGAPRVSWYPSQSTDANDDDPTIAEQTRPHAIVGDDDPTIARPGLHGGDDDPTISRPALPLTPIDTLLDHRYQLIRKIGKGGMGEVWEARHVQLDHAVAIKFLTQEAGGPRFKREAQAIVSIRHSGVVDVLDFGETAQRVPYFAMELVHGETLSARVRRQGPLSWALVRNIALEVSDALAHAHAAGVIHRDLKPSNVLVLDAPPPRGSSTKLIDFGIAKLLDASQPRLTKTGYIQGTPAYMSPEQVLGEPVDARADVYGLGCLLYYLLCGHKPFAGKSGTAALRAQIYEMPPRFAEVAPDATIPAEVEAVVVRAMAKDKHSRFESMIEMQAAILAIPPDASASMSNTAVTRAFVRPPPLVPPGDTLFDYRAEDRVSGPGVGGSGDSSSLTQGTTNPGRSFAETLQLIAAIGGSAVLIAAAIAGLIWALTG